MTGRDESGGTGLTGSKGEGRTMKLGEEEKKGYEMRNRRDRNEREQKTCKQTGRGSKEGRHEAEERGTVGKGRNGDNKQGGRDGEVGREEREGLRC